jgi:HSP20 family protein
MERFFERLGDWESPELRPMADWTPKLDFSESRDAYMLKAEIPGIDPKEVSVSLEGEVLTLKGEKRQEKEEKEERYHRVERSFGAFVRAMRLPGAVDCSKVTAGFRNGVLTVTLPKAPSARANTIPVKAE